MPRRTAPILLLFLSAAAAHADIIVGAGPGGFPTVEFHAAGGGGTVSFPAYGPAFQGGVRVAAGDVNGDGISDIITGTGAGSPGGHVKVFSGSGGAELASFFAYNTTFSGGVHVAAGDLDGDGHADVITGAGAGASGGHVRVFSGATGAQLSSFFAFDGFTGGVRVAAGDINGDGQPDIITGAGAGGPGGHVKVFSGSDGSLLRSFFAYDPNFAGGVYVASGDVDGDGWADVITGTGDDDLPGSAPAHVKVFSGQTGGLLASFFAFDAFMGGVRVAAADLTGDGLSDIITGAGPGGPPHVKVFDGATGSVLDEFFALSPSFAGGIYVAAVPAPGTVLPALAILALAHRRRRR